ncbi:MAG: enoyl-CoA hydratase-related protein [Syntrophomonas sp.]
MSYREKQYNTILLTIEDNVAIVQFNRPQAMNALNREMGDERNEILAGIANDPEIRAVIITGGEKVFCAGGDLAAFSKFGVVEAREHAERIVSGERLLANFPKPTIAAIAGFALGGGMEMVLMCDLRVAAENAKFAQPEINVGIIPGAGATQRLVQHTSICKAKEMIMLGDMVDAQTALELGIINKIVPLEELMDAARKWAKKLAAKPPVALRMAKKTINNAWSCDIETGMAMEADAWGILFGTEDQKEGMNAFLEKRRPFFTGK